MTGRPSEPAAAQVTGRPHGAPSPPVGRPTRIVRRPAIRPPPECRLTAVVLQPPSFLQPLVGAARATSCSAALPSPDTVRAISPTRQQAGFRRRSQNSAAAAARLSLGSRSVADTVPARKQVNSLGRVPDATATPTAVVMESSRRLSPTRNESPESPAQFWTLSGENRDDHNSKVISGPYCCLR